MLYSLNDLAQSLHFSRSQLSTRHKLPCADRSLQGPSHRICWLLQFIGVSDRLRGASATLRRTSSRLYVGLTVFYCIRQTPRRTTQRIKSGKQEAEVRTKVTVQLATQYEVLLLALLVLLTCFVSWALTVLQVRSQMGERDKHD